MFGLAHALRITIKCVWLPLDQLLVNDYLLNLVSPTSHVDELLAYVGVIARDGHLIHPDHREQDTSMPLHFRYPC
jgi:hypothetical protein